jgi:hypothetical protein
MGPNVLVSGWLFVVPKAAVILVCVGGHQLVLDGFRDFLRESLRRRQFKSRNATPEGHYGRQRFTEIPLRTSWKNRAVSASKAGG